MLQLQLRQRLHVPLVTCSYIVIPCSGVTNGPTISKQFTCDATMNTAPIFSGSACIRFTSPSASPRTNPPAAAGACSRERSSASDGHSNAPTYSCLPPARRQVRTWELPSNSTSERLASKLECSE